MSENVMSSGLFAILKNPVDDVQQEELNEILWDKDTGLSINYEGTLIYSDVGGSEYGIRFALEDEFDKQTFIESCKEYHLDVDETSIRPYSCYYYNGSDSDMSMLTLEEYKKILE